MSNPLKDYRDTHRQIRALFADFTSSHCPDCANPCCRRPARIDDYDVLLAEALGCLPDQAVHWMGSAETLELVLRGDVGDEPCEFLGEDGCSFPSDLRPLGCTTYVCKFMERDLSNRELREIKSLARKLERLRDALLRAVGVRRR